MKEPRGYLTHDCEGSILRLAGRFAPEARG
jgi:hypothetical protein